MIQLSVENITAYILVFARMAGMIALNPLLSRRNLTSRVRMGLILGLTLLLTPVIDQSALQVTGTFELILCIGRELFAGFVLSYVFGVFYYLLFFAGDLMDVQFGLSMAKVFDPGTNIQVSVSGNIISILFIFYVFATDSHLLLIQLFASSYDVLPVGIQSIHLDISGFAITLFTTAMSLIIRLTLPFIAVEFIIEMAMGILMKLIPQIHVFVLNIQLKLFVALLMLFAFAQPVADFMDRYVSIMFQNLQQALITLAG